ncbi:MAG: DinB family protein [Bryobacterales bacterium]|nr:DinB family protein [Bryobacterales bacterium]
MPLAREFRHSIAAAHRTLAAMDPGRAHQPFRESGWQRVELLGHLIGSCLYNHVRFLNAVNKGSLAVERYDPLGSVRLHNYAALDWEEVLDNRRIHNELLARAVDRMPEAAHAIECRLEDGETMRLDELVRDYLRHIEHHIAQLA